MTHAVDANGIIDIEKIDYSLITISEIRGAQGANEKSNNPTDSMKTARIMYGDNKLLLRMGKYPTPWGLGPPMTMKKESGSPQPFRLDLSLGRSPESDPAYRLGMYIDGLVRKLAEENPKDMLNRKTFSDDLFEERFRGPCVRFSRDPATRELRDYPPSLRISVPISPMTNKFQVDGFFSADRKALDITPENATTQICRGDQVRCLVLYDKVWINSIGFGVKNKLVQCRVYKAPMRLDVDLTGGDADDVLEAVHMEETDHMGVDEDSEMERANYSLSGMRNVAEATR